MVWIGMVIVYFVVGEVVFCGEIGGVWVGILQNKKAVYFAVSVLVDYPRLQNQKWPVLAVLSRPWHQTRGKIQIFRRIFSRIAAVILL